MMPRSEILYQVCDTAPDGQWEPLGLLYNDRTQAGQELRRMKRLSPTVFLARVVYTRVNASVPRRLCSV